MARMLFNSIDFAIFLPIVFAIYWIFHRSIKVQNIILLVASYVFYGWWDWRFLILIFISSIVDYFVGLKLGSTEKEKNRKLLLAISLIVNLGLLAFFKYFDFFIDSFVNTFSLLGYSLNSSTLNIILPVGISFYTFQTLSYTIDLYRKKISPTNNLIDFLAFVSFFPQLVAGPIERAKNLLPQFQVKREFKESVAIDGVRQIAWGLFKKIAVADTLGIVVDRVFAAPYEMSFSMLLLGVIYFAFQVYADFSGYSDIALGTAKLFGFKLSINFRYPFFATNIAELWRRWHISLVTWIRDYVYYPLGGNKKGKLVSIRNILIVFLLSGLWHGASWHYVLWGGLNGLFFIPLILKDKTDLLKITGAVRQGFNKLGSMILTFFIFALLLVFFRAENIPYAISYLTHLFSFTSGETFVPAYFDLYLIVTLLIFDWIGRKHEHPLQVLPNNRILRFLIYFLVVYLTLINIDSGTHEFIYFQF